MTVHPPLYRCVDDLPNLTSSMEIQPVQAQWLTDVSDPRILASAAISSSNLDVLTSNAPTWYQTVLINGIKSETCLHARTATYTR